MTTTVDTVTTLTKATLDPIFDNTLAHTILLIVLTIYAGYTAPLLPNSIANLFQFTHFRLLILFIIVYGVTNKLRISLIVSLGGYFLFGWLLESKFLYWAEETGDSLFSRLDDDAKTLVQKVEDGVEGVYDEVGRDASAAYNFVKTEASDAYNDLSHLL